MSTLIEHPLTIHRPLAAVARPTEASPWTLQDVQALFELPFPELLHRAQTIHREHFDPTLIEFATCSRSRPAAAPRIAAIAPRRPATIPASKLPN